MKTYAIFVFFFTDSSDIVDCKLKLILGLIWTLILHYSISMPMWEGDDEAPEKEATPKQRLLAWIQNKVPDRPITNFTSDWNDGTAIGALVDAIAPGKLLKASNFSSNKNLSLQRTPLNIAMIEEQTAYFYCLVKDVYTNHTHHLPYDNALTVCIKFHP